MPHWRPTGWFQIGWTRRFPSGEVRALRYFGQDLVAYRTADGRLHVLDAHCRHLGAHLGYGGTVQDDCVVCPFHGWHWDPDGRNRYIPYQEDRPNKSRRLRSWPTYEHAGVVYMWHDVAGNGPTWAVPDIFTDTAAHTAALRYHDPGPRRRSATANSRCTRNWSVRTPQIPSTSVTSTEPGATRCSSVAGSGKACGSAKSASVDDGSRCNRIAMTGIP